jgi:hypothetical protein
VTIACCEPVIRSARSGYSATTPNEYPYRIGVVGTTEADARERFGDALAAWTDLHDRAVAAGTVVA